MVCFFTTGQVKKKWNLYLREFTSQDYAIEIAINWTKMLLSIGNWDEVHPPTLNHTPYGSPKSPIPSKEQ